MTEKKKVRKVVAEGVVNSGGYLLRKNGGYFKLADLMGKEVEVVVFVESEMIRPKGVEWVTVCIPGSLTNNDSFLQLSDVSKLLVARVTYADDTYCWRCDNGVFGHKQTIELARQAAEEVLADAGLHGFCWEVPDAKNTPQQKM